MRWRSPNAGPAFRHLCVAADWRAARARLLPVLSVARARPFRASAHHEQRCPPFIPPMVAGHQSWPPAALMVNGMRKLLTKSRDLALGVAPRRSAIIRKDPPS